MRFSALVLKASGNELYCHAWPTESGKHDYEIDFLPSGYRTHASLDAFQKKFSGWISRRYLVYTKDFRKDADVFMVLVFMTMFL